MVSNARKRSSKLAAMKIRPLAETMGPPTPMRCRGKRLNIALTQGHFRADVVKGLTPPGEGTIASWAPWEERNCDTRRGAFGAPR